MQLVALAPERYLGGHAIAVSPHCSVRARGGELRRLAGDDVGFAEQAFLFVRDDVRHPWDAQDRTVTLSASDLLREGVGLCFGKAPLLAALLRAAGIPAGPCYQRLRDDAGARFSLEVERLAWPVQQHQCEIDYLDVFPEPDANVVRALQNAKDMLKLRAHGLPEQLASRL